jgi:hypothetical protein
MDINKNKQISQENEDTEDIKINKPKLIKLKDPKFKFLSFEGAQLAKIKNDEKKQIDFLNNLNQDNMRSIKGLEDGFHYKRNEDDKNQLASWKKNMEIKREFEEGQHNELFKQANFLKKVVFESMKNAETENKIQIENFEKNLSRLGLDTSNQDQKLKKPNKATLASEIVLQKIREKIEANTKAKKERDRRKRKIQIEQKKAQEEIERYNKMLSKENENNVTEPLDISTINENKKKEFSDWKKLHEIGAEEEAQKRIEMEFYEREHNKNYTEIFDDYYALLNSTAYAQNLRFDKKKFIESVCREDLSIKNKELLKKKEKREKTTPFIKKILDDILFIVDDVDKNQKDLNSEFLDRDNWKELMHLFEDNTLHHKLGNYLSNKNSEFDLIKNTNQNKLTIDSHMLENVSSSQCIIEGLFEECETFDYLNFIGEYEIKNVIPYDLLNKMLDIFDMVGGDMLLEMANNNRKNNKVITSSKDYEPTDEDIQNLTIPKMNEKNFFLTDIVNILVDIKSTTSGFNENNVNYKSQNGNENGNNLLSRNNNSANNPLLNNNSISRNNTANNNNKVTEINKNKPTTVSIINNNISSAVSQNKNLIKGTTTNQDSSYTNTNTNNNIYINTLNNNNSNKDENSNNNIIIEDSNNSKINISHINITSQNSQINLANLFNNIPIKILFLGKKFSGRKTQVKLLSENFGLKFYNVEELIEKNLKIYSKLELSLENTTGFKNMKKNEAERAVAERDLEEKNFEPIKPFVANIKRYKDECQEVPQNYIFDFIIELIKNDFPEKSQNVRLEELKEKTRRKKELQDELNKIREEKLTLNKDSKAIPPKPESYFIGELNKLSKESNKGFILIDYPYNLSQAKFFEIKINNYISENEKPKNILETMKQNFNLILDSISKPNITKNLVEGVFDFIFYLDVSNSESLKRAKNRKIDPVTGIVYHIEENQNIFDDKKVFERLLPYEQHMNHNEFTEKNTQYENEIKQMENFYSTFGHQKINLNTYKKITSMSELSEKNNNSKENIIKNFNEISNLLNQKIKLNEEKDEELLNHINSQRENQAKDKESIKESFNNTINSQNYDGKSNTYKNQEGMTGSIIGGEKLSRKPSIKSKKGTDFGKTNDKSVSKNNLAEIHGSIDNTENDNMEVDKSTNALGLKTGNDKNIQNLDAEDFNKYHKKLEETKKKIAPYMIENIFGIWNRSYTNYLNGSKLFFLNLRKQKESIILRYNKLQENFIEYLRRPSKKSIDINNFYRKYNSFFDEFPHLIGDITVKDEFRKDVKDLSDNIWDIIEIRKSEVIEERKRIMEVGFIKKEIDKFYFNVEKLFILEVEKLCANINILREYYFAMDLKPNSIDTMKFNLIDILKNKEVNSTPIIIEDSKYENFDNENENQNQKYPRLEKLYKNCFKLLIKYDEILKNIDKISKSNAINNNSSESSLRKNTKVHYKRYHESTFVDEKREIFIYDEEMKNSIKAEKNKFKFRVTFIKFWAIKYFNNIRKITKMVYSKLDDWIISTIKAENDAMNNLINVFNNCIEKGMKIRNDFEMDSFDFYKTKDINEFIDITVKYKIIIKFELIH